MSNDFDSLSSPARRALAAAGYMSLADLAKVAESEVASLHGMGPKALQILRARLEDAGLAFRP